MKRKELIYSEKSAFSLTRFGPYQVCTTGMEQITEMFSLEKMNKYSEVNYLSTFLCPVNDEGVKQFT